MSYTRNKYDVICSSYTSLYLIVYAHYTSMKNFNTITFLKKSRFFKPVVPRRGCLSSPGNLWHVWRPFWPSQPLAGVLLGSSGEAKHLAHNNGKESSVPKVTRVEVSNPNLNKSESSESTACPSWGVRLRTGRGNRGGFQRKPAQLGHAAVTNRPNHGAQIREFISAHVADQRQRQAARWLWGIRRCKA